MRPLYTLFDMDASAAARDASMQQAEDAANPEWQAYVSELIVEVARNCAEFTTDEVEWLRLQRGGPSTHEPRAMGPLMIAAAKRGVCTKTDRTQASSRVCNHRRPLRVWRSLIHKPE